MEPADICERAASLVSSERATEHGDYRDSFESIATMWNGYLVAREGSARAGSPLLGEDVANLMELLKIARRLNGKCNLDDYVDGAGYAALAGAMAAPTEANTTMGSAART
jgi:hypothetical protein